MEATRGIVSSRMSGKCESVEVACEANELWRCNLKLHEWWLWVAEKQLAGNNHLIKVVQALTGALDQTGLGGVSAHARVGVSKSGQKEKERADAEVSLGASNEDNADGEGEGCRDGDEGDD